MSPIAANEEIYLLLKEGYKYKASGNDEDDVTVKIIDWQYNALVSFKIREVFGLRLKSSNRGRSDVQNIILFTLTLCSSGVSDAMKKVNEAKPMSQLKIFYSGQMINMMMSGQFRDLH